jgi:hypothetical protein
MSKYLPATLGIAAMLLASTSLAQARSESEKSSIIAASDCVAEAALNNPNIETFYRENRLKQVTDWIVLKSDACDNPLKAMRMLHDRIYGAGTGRRFLLGDYRDDLPRAVRERISDEMESRMAGTTPEVGGGGRAIKENGPRRIWEHLPDTPLANGANLRVVNKGANDILTMRESPTEESRGIHMIPPDGTGIVYQGSTEGQWVFVQYERANGCVNGFFVQPIVPRGGKF